VTDDLRIDRPITGAKFEEPRKVNQLSAAEFTAEIDRLLALDGVVGVIWEQYTPYFNDGDPCEFGVREVRLLLDDDSVEDDDYQRGVSTYSLYQKLDYVGTWPDRRPDYDTAVWTELKSGNAREIYIALHELNTRAWEEVAKANFGDHAEVTATKDGFNVEYYEHD
jgi:hypothetical protein